MKEYIVSLRSHEELEEFYDDMETPGGNLYIPDRMVDVSLRRPLSRNTHYMLTEEESNLLKNDPRVLYVTPFDEFQNNANSRSPEFTFTQTGTFNKNAVTAVDTHVNWGIYRCIRGTAVAGWGYDAATSINTSVNFTATGKNVDVVIMDGHLDVNHPEYAVAPDGSGGSRVVQYNWYQHTAELGLGSNGTYTYPTGTSLINSEDDHGAHVAGIAAGNVHGWARRANIYNISPYLGANNPNTLGGTYPWDYVRAWHLSKPINPETGRRNPTIVNASFGSSPTITRSAVTKITWRGVDYTALTDADLDTYGIAKYTASTIQIPGWHFDSEVIDIEDMINAGVLLCGSAGNLSYKEVREGDQDYNNSITYTSGISTTRYYHRGDFRYRTNIICVGALSMYSDESKATFSHCGNRVDVFAPGQAIMSGVTTTTGTVCQDSRNGAYYIGKKQGTSMASPQVTGVLACALESMPRMTQVDAIAYLNQHSTTNQMTTTSGGYTDLTDLQGAPNKILFFKKERRDNGVLQPRETHKSRPNNGQMYPRKNTFYYKK